jgi:hypothetical protein
LKYHAIPAEAKSVEYQLERLRKLVRRFKFNLKDGE